MIPEKKTYEFCISGVMFKLKTSHDQQTVKELVDYVNDKINQASTATRSGSFQNATILAALNIAEELLLLKRKASQELQKLEDKTYQLASELENNRLSRTTMDV